MSSSAYHWKPRLVESKSAETVDPWLDDKTTTPYRRDGGRSRTLRTLQPQAAAPSQPSAADVSQSVTLVSGATPARPTPARPTLARPTLKLERGSAQPAKPRKRQATTMKIERVPVLTPDQRAHYTLEAYWREQQKLMRARSTKRLWIGALTLALLVGAILLRLFGSTLLPGWSWQRVPQVKLVDLFTRSRAPSSLPSTGTVAPSDVQSHVMVTAAAPDALAQPATLRIDSQPWARVFVDDVLIGNTPQLAIRIQPGTHNVRLHNPERSLHKAITLDARPGETIQRLEQLER